MRSQSELVKYVPRKTSWLTSSNIFCLKVFFSYRYGRRNGSRPLTLRGTLYAKHDGPAENLCCQWRVIETGNSRQRPER